ncbi:MAG TPA: HAMP domain-containing sensor histidine kinase, partial [Patescibacteria group bacterium]|nr:HAMP domain-containing sensor histidine kinase [Patescibacteria group bacterium]
IQYGKAMWPFLLGITFLIGSVLYVLFSGWKSLSPEEKKALYPFLTGLAIFYVFNMIFNISLPIFFKITRFYFLGDYTTVVLTAMVAYSIVRHKFLGVKVVLSAFLISTIGLLLVIDTFLLSTTFWEQLFKGFIFVVFLLISFLLIKTLNTESKQKEELERLIKELEEKEKRMVFLTEMNDIKTSFLSLISHHLRTPLTPLIGYMEALKSDRSIPSGTKSALEGMDESVTKLRKLFEKIIHIASLQTDDEPLHFTSLDFTQLIHRVANERIVALTREKGLRLSLPNLTTSCIIEADEKLLEEALFNILENAVQFTDKGEITLTIQENKSKTCLSVQDTGKGMAETYQKQLFTLFARPKDTVFQFDQKGVGLGLYVSKLILEKHHGTIEIQSQLGKGTTCTICLPLTQK